MKTHLNRADRRRFDPKQPRNLKCTVCRYRVKPGPNAVTYRGLPHHQSCLDTLIARAAERRGLVEPPFADVLGKVRADSLVERLLGQESA